MSTLIVRDVKGRCPAICPKRIRTRTEAAPIRAINAQPVRGWQRAVQALAYSRLSTVFSIFPAGLRGRLSTKSTSSGSHHLATTLAR